MRNKNLRLIVIFLVIINLVFFGVFSPLRSVGFTLLKTSSIGIDGIITETEWSNADWNISFYLDINNTADWNGKINVDGNNTMYIGQDGTNLYIALDLWCDRSDNTTGEWVGVWLNTINRNFSYYTEWLDYLNDGAESLIHNVETDQPWDPFIDTIDDYIQFLENDSAYTSIYGETEGTWGNFQYVWRDDFNITSELVGLDQLYRLDFSIDLDDWFPYFEFFEAVQGMEVDVRTKSNITIDNHNIIFWYSNGSMPPMTDIDQVKSLNKGTSYQTDAIAYDIGNLTTDHEFKFSLFGNHTDPFMINLDILNFRIFMNETNSPGLVGIPLSSIKNYQIAWGFGPSPGNTTDHRMFEISIPISELEHYKSDTELGIIVGGYGTMAIVGTNWWVFSKVNYYLPYFNSSLYNYYQMIAITSSAAIPAYNPMLIIAVISVISIVFIKKRLKKI